MNDRHENLKQGGSDAGCVQAYGVDMVEMVRDAIENAVLASVVANEPFGAQATRATYAALEASHHAELVSERDALAKRVSDLEADCDSYAKTFAVIDEQANAEANKLVHHAELVEALRQMRDHPACPVQVGVIGDAVLAKIGGGR